MLLQTSPVSKIKLKSSNYFDHEDDPLDEIPGLSSSFMSSSLSLFELKEENMKTTTPKKGCLSPRSSQDVPSLSPPPPPSLSSSFLLKKKTQSSPSKQVRFDPNISVQEFQRGIDHKSSSSSLSSANDQRRNSRWWLVSGGEKSVLTEALETLGLFNKEESKSNTSGLLKQQQRRRRRRRSSRNSQCQTVQQVLKEQAVQRQHVGTVNPDFLASISVWNSSTVVSKAHHIALQDAQEANDYYLQTTDSSSSDSEEDDDDDFEEIIL